MLNKFFEENRHVFEFIGILIAIGAIFLAIPAPDNSKAKDALMDVQLIWLIIISFSVIVIAFKFIGFFIGLEDRAKLKKLDFDGSLVNIPILVSLVFLFYLWKYIFVLYSGRGIARGGLSGVLLAVVFVPYLRCTLSFSTIFWDIYQKNIKHYLYKIFSYTILGSVIMAFFLRVLFLDFSKWYISLLLMFFITYAFIVVPNYFSYRKSMVKKVS